MLMFGFASATGCDPTAPSAPPPVRTVDMNLYANLAPDGTYQYRFSPNLYVDVYRRKQGTAQGTIVWLHGGGLTGGDRTAKGGMGEIWAQLWRGWDIVSVDYRLLDVNNASTKYPGQLADVIEAIHWVLGNGGTMVGLAQSRLVVVGHSAGGLLAGWMGANANSVRSGLSVPNISAWMSISAPLAYNQAEPAFSTLVNPNDPNSSSDRLFELWVNGNIFNLPLSDAVPFTNYGPTDPDGYLVHGIHDPIISIKHAEQTALYAELAGFNSRLGHDFVSSAPDDSNHFALGGADADRMDAWFDSTATL